MRTPRTLPLRAAALVLPLVLLGCKIDGEKIEKSIVEELDKQGIKSKAACPKDITEKKDGAFQCTVTLGDGAPSPVEVKMLGEGNVKWSFVPPVADEKKDDEKTEP